MKNIWLNISKNIDPIDLEILKEIDSLSKEINIPYLLVGAQSLHYLLSKYKDTNLLRRTFDLDFGVMVNSWEEYKNLGPFLKSKGWINCNNQRWKTKKGKLVDFVPFGNISDSKGFIAWPPDSNPIMEVSGFKEAFLNSVFIQIDPKIKIPIPSFCGITILKLLAWISRGYDQKKDAIDLMQIFKSSIEYFIDELYSEPDLKTLEAFNDDNLLASAYLLGKEVKKIITKLTLEKLNHISLENLALDMSQNTIENSKYIFSLLESFNKGLN